MAEPTITLDEFCKRISSRVRAVALISGFHTHATLSGWSHKTEADWLSEFDKFCKAPA